MVCISVYGPPFFCSFLPLVLPLPILLWFAVKLLGFERTVQCSRKGVIKKEIENKTANVIMPLCKTMYNVLYNGIVHWNIAYSAGCWTSKKDIVELEKVQKRVTKMLTGLGYLHYGVWGSLV